MCLYLIFIYLFWALKFFFILNLNYTYITGHNIVLDRDSGAERNYLYKTHLKIFYSAKTKIVIYSSIYEQEIVFCISLSGGWLY